MVVIGEYILHYLWLMMLNLHELLYCKLKLIKMVETIIIPLKYLGTGIIACFKCHVKNQSKIAISE